VSPQRFDAIVERAIEAVPARFRKRLKNVVFVVEDESRERNLLGVHETNPPFPDRIVIFQRPHERQSRTLAELERLVFETILHEIGHHFGMNEGEVLRMERRRKRAARFGTSRTKNA
jgi:predicted Zn-dependent protease with MMP-like domain